MIQQRSQLVKMLIIWLSIAVLFGVLLGFAEYSRSHFDDPDPALQRQGSLIPATFKVPEITPGFPRTGRPLLVIFVRSVEGQLLFHDLAVQSDLSLIADIILVSSDGREPNVTVGLSAVVADKDGTIAKTYQLNTPIDGGYPVGFAVIDRQGFLRYATLDPHCVGMSNGVEINAILSNL